MPSKDTGRAGSPGFRTTPMFALRPDLFPSALRSQANSVVNIMSGIGGIPTFVVGPPEPAEAPGGLRVLAPSAAAKLLAVSCVSFLCLSGIRSGEVRLPGGQA